MPPISFTEEEQQELAGKLAERLDSFKASIQPTLTRVDYYRRVYRQDSEARSFPWSGASSFVSPLARVMSDMTTLFMFNSLRGADPQARLHPPSYLPVDDQLLRYTEQTEEHLQCINTQQTNFMQAIQAGLGYAAIEKGCFIKQNWKKEEKSSYRRGKNGWTTKRSTTYDNPYFEVIRLEDLYWYPFAVDNIQDALDAGHRFIVTWQELKDNEYSSENPDGIFFNIDKITSYQQSAEGRMLDAKMGDGFMPPQELRRGLIECHEILTKATVDGVYMDVILTLARKQKLLIGARPYDLKHGMKWYVPIIFDQDKEIKLLNYSTIEKTLQMQEAVSSTHRQAFDARTLANMPIFRASTMALTTNGPAIQDLYPGKMIEADSANDFSTVDIPGPSQDVPMIESMYWDQAQKLTGVTQERLGTVKTNSTLGQSRIANMNANVITDSQVWTLSNCTLLPLWRMELGLLYQFGSRKLAYRDKAGNPAVLDVEALKYWEDFEILPHASSASADRDRQAAMAGAFYQLLISTNPLYNPQAPQEAILSFAANGSLLRNDAMLRWLARMNGITDLDELMYSHKETAQLNRMLRMDIASRNKMGNLAIQLLPDLFEGAIGGDADVYTKTKLELLENPPAPPPGLPPMRSPMALTNGGGGGNLALPPAMAEQLNGAPSPDSQAGYPGLGSLPGMEEPSMADTAGVLS